MGSVAVRTSSNLSDIQLDFDYQRPDMSWWTSADVQVVTMVSKCVTSS